MTSISIIPLHRRHYRIPRHHRFQLKNSKPVSILIFIIALVSFGLWVGKQKNIKDGVSLLDDGKETKMQLSNIIEQEIDALQKLEKNVLNAISEEISHVEEVVRQDIEDEVIALKQDVKFLKGFAMDEFKAFEKDLERFETFLMDEFHVARDAAYRDASYLEGLLEDGLNNILGDYRYFFGGSDEEDEETRKWENIRKLVMATTRNFRAASTYDRDGLGRNRYDKTTPRFLIIWKDTSTKNKDKMSTKSLLSLERDIQLNNAKFLTKAGFHVDFLCWECTNLSKDSPNQTTGFDFYSGLKDAGVKRILRPEDVMSPSSAANVGSYYSILAWMEWRGDNDMSYVDFLVDCVSKIKRENGLTKFIPVIDYNGLSANFLIDSCSDPEVERYKIIEYIYERRPAILRGGIKNVGSGILHQIPGEEKVGTTVVTPSCLGKSDIKYGLSLLGRELYLYINADLLVGPNDKTIRFLKRMAPAVSTARLSYKPNDEEYEEGGLDFMPSSKTLQQQVAHPLLDSRYTSDWKIILSSLTQKIELVVVADCIKSDRSRFNNRAEMESDFFFDFINSIKKYHSNTFHVVVIGNVEPPIDGIEAIDISNARIEMLPLQHRLLFSWHNYWFKNSSKRLIEGDLLNSPFLTGYKAGIIISGATSSLSQVSSRFCSIGCRTVQLIMPSSLLMDGRDSSSFSQWPKHFDFANYWPFDYFWVTSEHDRNAIIMNLTFDRNSTALVGPGVDCEELVFYNQNLQDENDKRSNNLDTINTKVRYLNFIENSPKACLRILLEEWDSIFCRDGHDDIFSESRKGFKKDKYYAELKIYISDEENDKIKSMKKSFPGCEEGAIEWLIEKGQPERHKIITNTDIYIAPFCSNILDMKLTAEALVLRKPVIMSLGGNILDKIGVPLMGEVSQKNRNTQIRENTPSTTQVRLHGIYPLSTINKDGEVILSDKENAISECLGVNRTDLGRHLIATFNNAVSHHENKFSMYSKTNGDFKMNPASNLCLENLSTQYKNLLLKTMSSPTHRFITELPVLLEFGELLDKSFFVVISCIIFLFCLFFKQFSGYILFANFRRKRYHKEHRS